MKTAKELKIDLKAAHKEFKYYIKKYEKHGDIYLIDLGYCTETIDNLNKLIEKHS